MATNEQLAYLAGIFDGEGTFTTHWKPDTLADGTPVKYLVPLMSICNTNIDIMDAVVDVFGRERMYHVQQRNPAKHKKVYKWYATNRLVARLAGWLVPYLKGKREQAYICSVLSRISHKQRKVQYMQGHRKPEWKMWVEEMMFNRTKELNKRGVDV